LATRADGDNSSTASIEDVADENIEPDENIESDPFDDDASFDEECPSWAQVEELGLGAVPFAESFGKGMRTNADHCGAPNLLMMDL
jgi:hypothetical protein